MANRLLKPIAGSLEAGVVKLYGSFLTSTSGTIASQSCKGFSVAKTATKTGRYTITLTDSWTALLICEVKLEGAADTAYGAGKATGSILRGVSVGANKVLYVQFLSGVTDTELDDGAKVYIELTLKNTSAY